MIASSISHLENKIAFVIPTKDRPDDLTVMLRSLVRQTRRPDQVIVVDGSRPDIRHVVDKYPELKITYVQVYPPSLAKQRNAGMQKLRSDITLAGYLDDDLELEHDAIEKMLSFWRNASAEYGGAVFNIVNSPMPKWTWLKSLFYVDNVVPGRVLPSGFTSILGHQKSDIDTDWLCGGATVWRREIIENYPYDEWYIGTGYMEDVDFSFKVREKYRLALVSAAKLSHYSPPVRSDRQYLLGKWQIVNRMYLVRKYRSRGLSISSAWIANVGIVFLHILQALLRLDWNSWNRARGNIAGIWSELAGNRDQIGGYLK